MAPLWPYPTPPPCPRQRWPPLHAYERGALRRVWRLAPEGLFLQTIYFPLLLQAEHSALVAPDVWAESDGVEVPGLPPRRLPLLDVSATADEGKGILYLSVVNLSREDDMSVDLRVVDAEVAAEGAHHVCTGRDTSVGNSFAGPKNVSVRRRGLKRLSGRCRVSLPRHSASVLEVSLG